MPKLLSSFCISFFSFRELRSVLSHASWSCTHSLVSGDISSNCIRTCEVVKLRDLKYSDCESGSDLVLNHRQAELLAQQLCKKYLLAKFPICISFIIFCYKSNTNHKVESEVAYNYSLSSYACLITHFTLSFSFVLHAL